MSSFSKEYIAKKNAYMVCQTYAKHLNKKQRIKKNYWTARQPMNIWKESRRLKLDITTINLKNNLQSV